MKVGIIGGGMMGLCLGYFLSKAGAEVEIFESSPALGGLAGSITLEGGKVVDRFYHTILSSDHHIKKLCSELGIADQLRFKETRMGFFYHGEIHPMNNMLDFLCFPPLGWIDRFRLGITVLYAQFIKDWQALDKIGVENWLVRLSGKRTYENIWKPMLRAKFDGSFEDTPATYIWSRLVRMKSTRGGVNQKEEAGHLIGGYSTLIQAMAKQIEACGGKIFLSQPVKEIIIAKDCAKGVQTETGVHQFDAVVATIQTPLLSRLIPTSSSEYQGLLTSIQYLGIIAPLLVLDQPLTGYWTLNITDDNYPFTGVIETTAYIDPKYVGGNHLVYLPKYTTPGSVWMDKTDEEIKSIWMDHLKRMFPDFEQRSIREFRIYRERFVEPLHGLDKARLIPPAKTPIKNLFLATSAQIFPTLTNGESTTQYARAVADMLVEELGATYEKLVQ